MSNNFPSFYKIAKQFEKKYEPWFFWIGTMMSGQGKYVLNYFSPRFDFKWDALRDLLPFIQFKKREKHPRRSVNFSKIAG